ncbi:hypothetical protein HaLaN_05158 [Haematococcus lacustris]|uniref:Uncharacterized protein n=1 Tax=Haematococcus lacustris TaxID=44745 RepID=A0A699YIA9_HAELA|nr:hypothetical protein HaLaN_05158 [Haematococcus lacustris]
MGKAPAAEQQLGLGGAMLLGATAGAAGQLVAVPADFVKTQPKLQPHA